MVLLLVIIFIAVNIFLLKQQRNTITNNIDDPYIYISTSNVIIPRPK